MTAEKQICLGICICQMTAILSGVSLLYLTVIVIIPAKDELAMGFNDTPIMCTTVEAVDPAADPAKKKECKWTTCGEWCLSKGSGKCVQIHVMVRNNGSLVNFRGCRDVEDEQCSALDVNITYAHKCHEGGCNELTGLYNCTKDIDYNICRDITPAFDCYSRKVDPTAVECTDEKCKAKLHGVYTCKMGKCRKMEDVEHYWSECERKCTKLKMKERNVVIFSRERLIYSNCNGMDSPDNDTSKSIQEVSKMQEWMDKEKALFIFCSYVQKVDGQYYDLYGEDCFNATLIDVNQFVNATSFMELLAIHKNQDNQTEWVIAPEDTLRRMNNTQLRINHEGCVNTLKKECTAFFSTHIHDGYDGITPDRFPCYFTDQHSDYVIGQYNPELSSLMLLVATILPGSLFILACSCLFFCSKSVGIDDEGHLKVTLLQSGGAGGNVNASEL